MDNVWIVYEIGILKSGCLLEKSGRLPSASSAVPLLQMQIRCLLQRQTSLNKKIRSSELGGFLLFKSVFRIYA